MKNSLATNLSSILKPIKDFWLIIALLVIFVSLTTAIVFFNRWTSSFSQNRFDDLRSGMVAEQDVVLQEDVVVVDEYQTALKVSAVKQLIIPIFKKSEDISNKISSNYNNFIQIVDSYDPNNGKSIETLFYEFQTLTPGLLTLNDFAPLVAVAKKQEFRTLFNTFINHVLNYGYFLLPEDVSVLGASEKVEFFFEEDRVEKSRVFLIGDIYTKEYLESYLSSLQEKPSFSADELIGVKLFFDNFLIENAFYDRTKSQKRESDEIVKVQPVTQTFKKGHVLIEKGFVITDEDISNLNLVRMHLPTVTRFSIIATAFYVFLLLVLSVYLLRPPIIEKSLSRNQILTVLLLIFVSFMTFIPVGNMLVTARSIPFGIFLPVTLVAMLVSILISFRTGIFISFIFSLLIFPVSSFDIFSFLFSLLSGIAATAIISDAEKRIELVKATLFITLLSSIIALVLGIIQQKAFSWIWEVVFYAALNGLICGILNITFLPILEHILNAPTRFRLMELSDLNAPTLKRMLTIAPGTYNHSVNVANLAETACEDIRANRLLARVGAYYHDIGKIDQAEYFTENQVATNKHDELKPSLSIAVIKSHVKVGMEQGKKLGLPIEVLDIISQHHGNSVIQYFYQRAIDVEGSDKISKEDFSYSSPRPGSREAAVVMLADSVEAATRSLKKPSTVKLQKIVHSIIMEKFQAKQLHDSHLTLRDLDVIESAFLRILTGNFHSRIAYPGQEEL